MLWIKQFRNKKLQSVMIFFIIGLCTLLISGSLIILTSMKKPYEDLVKETKAAEVKIYPNVNPQFSGKDWVEVLENTKGVKKACELKVFSVDMLKLHGKKKDAFLDVSEYNKASYGNVRILEGELKNIQEGECGVPSAIANTLNLNIGDEIEFSMEGKKVSYKIVAIYADIYSISTAYTSDVIVYSLPSGLTLTESVYLTWLEQGYTDDDFITEYTDNNDGILDGYFRTASDSMLIGIILLSA